MLQGALRLHATDNVALALLTLPSEEELVVGGERVRLREAIPYGHKFALRTIPKGGRVVKYGYSIGRTTHTLMAGEHVHVHNLASGREWGDAAEPFLPGTCLDISKRPAYLSHELCALRHHEFMGYRRADGRVGVRNHVLALASVHCANGTVERIGHVVPEIVALPHVYGCSQLGEDLKQTRRVLEAYATNPNVGAVLLIGLGCETIPTEEMANQLAERGFLIRYLIIQKEGGSQKTVEKGIRISWELLEEAAQTAREPVSASELVVGIECGGSDAWSGVTANPAVGVAADILVRLGGTVILSEVTEFIGAEHLLAARAASPEVGSRILEAVARREGVAKEMGVDLRGAQPSPGNMVGGLTTIEEKSLGAITKGGTSQIQEFLSYGHLPKAKGLVVMDTSGNDLESVTAMVAGGAQIVLFTTGRGSPVGNPIAPVIKVASNTLLYDWMRADMDVNAGPVLEGESLTAVGRRIVEFLFQVAVGRPTCTERWGHREFAIEPRGPRV